MPTTYTANDLRHMAAQFHLSGFASIADQYDELAALKEKFDAGWKLVAPAEVPA